MVMRSVFWHVPVCFSINTFRENWMRYYDLQFWDDGIFITSLDIIRRPEFYLKQNFSETVFGLGLLVEPNKYRASFIYWAQLSSFHLKTPVSETSCFK
jgi:hypothetical protein